MKRFVFIFICLSIFLVGCGGSTGQEVTPVPFGQVPEREPGSETGREPEEDASATETETPVAEQPTEVSSPTQPPATATTVPEEEGTPEPGAFRQLRFATSGDGAGQAGFPIGTQEVYALWDYTGIKNGDTMQRVWYLNNELYVERTEAWNFGKYGASGTRQDVFMYDYIDGIDAGQWRVELYLNNELQVESGFTVQ